MKTYKTISSKSEGFFKDRGSKFFAYAYPVSSEDDVKQRLKDLRAERHDARHHCYAYVLGADQERYRSNDDGEPSNSAGPPIHGQIQAFDLTNILVVVVRYFGGTKLGVGGLITAYREAAKDALEQANVVTKEVRNTYTMDYAYDQTGPVKRLLEQYGAEITKESFQDRCEIWFRLSLSTEQSVVDQLALLGLTPRYIDTI